MSRLELPGGQWAELREWLTHGEEKTVLKAWAAASKNIEDAPDVDTALVRAYVSETGKTPKSPQDADVGSGTAMAASLTPGVE